MTEKPYNPLEKRRLGESVAKALLEKPVVPLPPERFSGAGIYAIYYTGDFGPYAPIAQKNRDLRFQAPIYVGKAVPPGARKGGYGLDATPGTALYERLCEHAKSVQQVSSLDLGNFHCRYCVADDIWIPLGESLLIEMFRPIWNVHIDGFGIHAPGKGRQRQRRSTWDTLHPGRPWASDLHPNERNAEVLIGSLEEYLRDNPP